MREDLLETVTTHMISGGLAELCLKLCRLNTIQEESELKKQYTQFNNLEIQQLGISNYFTLNKTSKLVEIINIEQQMAD